MQEKAYLAFDLGASSGRAILGRFDGRQMQIEELHRFPTPILEEGERLYWDLPALEAEVRTGLSRALDRVPELRSVSVDSWGVDYVPLDASGVPVRNAACYRDPRVQGMMAKAQAVVPAAEIYRATGIQFMEINSLYQLLADKEQEPDLCQKAATRLLIADYLNHKLGGRPVAEISLASTSQVMDVRGGWALDLLDRLGLPTKGWPEIVPSGTRIGQVPGTEVEVVAGCSHDTGCAVAAVPADAAEGNWAYLSCGTWSLLGVELDAPVVTEQARLVGFTNEAGVGGTIRFLKNLTGLWVLQECEREWRTGGQQYTYQEIIAEAEATPCSGYLADLNDPRFALRGGMQDRLKAYCAEKGIPVPESRGAVVRLILESMAEGHRRALAELEAVTGQKVEVLHVVGGGSRNEMLCRLTAQACGCKVVAGPAEATALGNLLVQALAMGDLPGREAIREVVRRSTDLAIYDPVTALP